MFHKRDALFLCDVNTYCGRLVVSSFLICWAALKAFTAKLQYGLWLIPSALVDLGRFSLCMVCNAKRTLSLHFKRLVNGKCFPEITFVMRRFLRSSDIVDLIGV